uniref:Uncharacterized protein n=1 Tax=Marseillevirus LCMAC102 TaxID=2506603 RepID=A0A481YT53_9VIRU|nr:MAG: hypothetical protein LCMAC102_00540 [Marseillevirus LCMAC102]
METAGVKDATPRTPCENFLLNLDNDPTPNFLRYTLLVLESCPREKKLLKAIRKNMEKKYKLDTTDVWAAYKK